MDTKIGTGTDIFKIPNLSTSPYNLFQSSIPMILPSSGTMGANGAVTLTVALPAAYPNAYVYFPAGAVYSGSVAGLYYTVMSSTTVGQVFNNTYASGVPVIPATPVAVVDAGPGAYTQTISDITLLSYTLPGGSLGINGRVQTTVYSGIANTAGSKITKIKVAGSTSAANGVTTSNSTIFNNTFQNRGRLDRQYSSSNIGSTSTGSELLSSYDTTADLTITVTGLIAVAATDFLYINSVNAQVMP